VFRGDGTFALGGAGGEPYWPIPDARLLDLERKTTLDNDGRFQIEHVRPGIYELQISGSGITASQFRIRVADDDINLGSLKLLGTGRIVGQVTEPDDGPSPSPWPFVRGPLVESDEQAVAHVFVIQQVERQCAMFADAPDQAPL
jgi:hypothetical protein